MEQGTILYQKPKSKRITHASEKLELKGLYDHYGENLVGTLYQETTLKNHSITTLKKEIKTEFELVHEFTNLNLMYHLMTVSG